MPLSAGDQFGPYLLIAAIGRGGMGEVWKARDTRLDRIVALKVSQEQFSERFEREAKAIAALNLSLVHRRAGVGPPTVGISRAENHRDGIPSALHRRGAPP